MIKKEVTATFGGAGELESPGAAPRYDHLANVMKPITMDSVSKERRLLSSEQKVSLEQVVGWLLVETGYESVL